MYRIFLQSVALAGLLFVCHFVRAQQASIQLIIPPPVELANRDQWNLLLLASTFDTLQVLLHGTVTEQMRGKVYEVNSAVFTLRPGNYLFNTSNYTLLEPEQVLFESRDFVEHISRTNTLPGGQYEVCRLEIASTDIRTRYKQWYQKYQKNSKQEEITDPQLSAEIALKYSWSSQVGSFFMVFRCLFRPIFGLIYTNENQIGLLLADLCLLCFGLYEGIRFFSKTSIAASCAENY